LDRRLVHRVWLGDGPRHWTPRKVVYIEYANPGEDPAVFSLQSFEAHFWPRTTSAARALYRQIEAWRAAQESALPPPLPCEAPRSGGDPDPSVALPLVLKSAAINAGAGYMLAEIFGSSDISSVWDFSAPLVCVCVTLFAAWPRLRPRG
ncbi:MAG: hypothetical protein LAO79_19180, partial [Acidobacteriia bacterium]|nr:hypothetical protein [Terriglobia bacterium]